MSDLIQLSITVDADAEELLSAVLAVNAPTGWAEETLPAGETRAVVHTENPVHAAELEEAVRASLPGAAMARSVVEQKNWALAWREYFTPVEAGRRFLVLAPWMEEERRAAARDVIVIEPKMAFGTGHHDTTALCLGALSDMADEGRVRFGMRFLDLGTGSGILGIGCALLGMTGLGLDIDVLAVENAEENCRVNGISSDGAYPVFVVKRGGIDHADETYDIVLANILAGPLIDMAPAIVRRMKENGALVLSGILAIQADNVAAAYEAAGLPAPRRRFSGEWAALIWD